MRDELLGTAGTLGPGAPLASLTDELTAEVPVEALQTAMPAVRRRRRWVTRSLILLTAAAMAAGGWYFRPATVPDVTGLAPAEATRSLRALGLEPSVRRVFSDAPEDQVFRSDPAPGRWVLKGADVTIAVSAGPELTDVPSLVGLHVDRAREAVAARGLVVGSVEERHDRQPQSTVLAQHPQPGKTRKGDPVNLTVSRGPEIISLPDVTGKPAAEAAENLQQRGFDVVREETFSETRAGLVAAQTPRAGEMIPQGTQIRLLVSKGPQPFAMPDLKGKSCTEARAAVSGLSVLVRSSSGEETACGANRVLEQDPLPGTKVSRGSEATFFVS